MTAPLTTEPGYRLAYIVPKEAYYARVVSEEAVTVGKFADEGGCAWEFQVVHHSGIGIRAEIFDDAFAAFAEVAPLFAAFVERKPQTLQTVRDILDGLGFADQTVRESPTGTRVERCGCGCDATCCRGPQ